MKKEICLAAVLLLLFGTVTSYGEEAGSAGCIRISCEREQ